MAGLSLTPAPRPLHRVPFRIASAALSLSLLLLLVLPEARLGLAALLNRLFAASEAVNAYAYRYFDVPAGQNVRLASILLIAFFAAWALALALSRSRWPVLFTAALLALGQAYFGLSLPGWANAAFFGLLGLKLYRPGGWKQDALFGAMVLAVTLAVFILRPGTDMAVEAASERVRDWLGQAVQSAEGALSEDPDSVGESRHISLRRFEEGEGESLPGADYRLVTLQEQQISRPDWLRLLRTILLLLAVAALVILPFLPFLALNRRREEARRKRQLFASEDLAEAIRALFGHVVAYLDAADLSPGNTPFQRWTECLSRQMGEAYGKLYEEAVQICLEAAYSNHPLEERQRDKVAELLTATEAALYDSAPWRQWLRLRYVACLHE